MTLDDKLRAIRDIIQQDIGNRGLAHDPERNLINAFPDDFAAACRTIGEHSEPSVQIVTGFWIPTAEPPAFETDGPLGAVYLSRALAGFGITTAIVSDAGCRDAILAGLEQAGQRKHFITAAGSRTAEPDGLSPISLSANTGVITWTTHRIALERVGPASDGRCYTMRGLDVGDQTSPVERLFTGPEWRFGGPSHPITGRRAWEVASIGIGDGGNEIGMGKIPVETIERNIPNGRKIACRVATDHLIVAGISNWGAYALAAGIALVRGQALDPSLFDVERERQILQAMVKAGPLVDGVSGRREATVDGIDFDTYIHPLLAIRDFC
jgi:hypothetical protein